VIGRGAGQLVPSDEWTGPLVAATLAAVADRRAPDLLVSDAERDHAATALREHLAEGRLTLDELAERLDRIYAARTRRELDTVGADLPAQAPPARARQPRRFLVAIMSGIERSRRWRLAPRTTVLAFMGGAHLDLRNAEIADSEASISCISVMGGIDIVVPEGVDVEVGGFGLMGGVADETRGVAPRGAPALRVHAFALMGGVVVRTLPHRPPSGADRVPDRLQLEE
jgi:Domain of unknown function (DUF1707)/Cell wall-active antibiotics response 4TMS YvqF